MRIALEKQKKMKELIKKYEKKLFPMSQKSADFDEGTYTKDELLKMDDKINS